MRIERIELHHIELPLVHPFQTSFGYETTRPCILIAAYAEGLVGWGECSAMAQPSYSYETVETAWHVLRDFLIPALLGQAIAYPDDAVALFAGIRGHPMARAAIESCVWDLLAQSKTMSLAALLGGQRERVPVGVSLGIEPTIPALLKQVEAFVQQGYRRVKLKIKPGWDVDVVRAVRERWPDLMLQVDANSAYTLYDMPIMRELDQFGLLFIEQPLHHDDILDHALLQTQIKTPLCLDESLPSPQHVRWALDSGACHVVNIKVGRVGGLSAAEEVRTLCSYRGVPVWCGGMLETNVGRALNLALASLPNFVYPGDISATARYYHEDIAEPDFTLNDDSTITVPTAPGIGVQVNQQRLEAACVRRFVNDSRWSTYGGWAAHVGSPGGGG
jgi:o-succinylbenzoate synthase